MLIERPGTLVLKDALIEAAWPGQMVEDSNLTVQIAALRRVLSEAPGGDRWIETRPRRRLPVRWTGCQAHLGRRRRISAPRHAGPFPFPA